MTLTDATPALEISRFSKTFAGQRVLHDVSLTVRSGEIHALVGHNGSGKSTLIKVLAGIYDPDDGAELRLDGRGLSRGGRDNDHKPRLHFLHQDLGLVANLSVVENLALGRGYRRGFGRRILWRQERAQAARTLHTYGLHIDVERPIGELSQAEQAIIAIIRALQGWDPDRWGVLVLDEPTAALASDGVSMLFDVIRRIAAAGAGVVFVTHRLDEVIDLADRATVLRDGELVSTIDVRHTRREDLVSLIVGHHDYAAQPEPPSNPAPTTATGTGTATMLQVRGLSGTNLGCLDLDVEAGEIVGIAGLLGSGREEVASLLFGATRASAGTVVIDGVPVPSGKPRSALTAGMGLVPADRRRDGLLLGFSVAENLVLPDLKSICRTKGWVSRSRERHDVAAWIASIDLRPPEPGRAMATLSGGNQQKVVLARWLRTHPKVLVLDEPTQGVDVAAKAQIYQMLRHAARAGTAMVVCSSDDEELEAICNRVLVLGQGRVIAELGGSAMTKKSIAAASHSPSTGARHA